MPSVSVTWMEADSQADEGPVTAYQALPTNQIPDFEVTLLTKKCRIQLGGPGRLQLTVTLLLEHPHFLGHREKTQLGAFSPTKEMSSQTLLSSAASCRGYAGVQTLCSEQPPLPCAGLPVQGAYRSWLFRAPQV